MRWSTHPAQLVGVGRVPVGRPLPASTRAHRRIDLRADALALSSLGILAFAIRALPMSMGAGITGLNGYDDGVYFAAATGLTTGLMPYRDFLLVHPPGIVLILAPFAALGSITDDATAMAIARIAITLLGALNAVLVALVAGRFDRRAGLVAGALYAVWNAVANVERTADMHGPQSTLLLLALLAIIQPGRIGPRRAALVGVLIGLLTSIQLWQGATAVVILWWIVVRGRGHGRRRFAPAVAYGVGAAIAFGLVCLPFLLAAPGVMIDQILLDQLGRPRGATSFFNRVRALEGFPQLPQLSPAWRRLLPPPLVGGVAVAALGLTIATAWHLPWTRPWAVLAIVQASIVLITPSFFNDYPSFAGPAAALVLGTGVALGGRALCRRGVPTAVVVTPLLVLGLGLAFVSVGHPEGLAVPIAELRRDLATARCVTADSPALLILTSTLRRDLANGCAFVADPTGYELGNRRLGSTAYQAAMLEWYTSGDAALFVRLKADGLSAETLATVAAQLPYEHADGAITVRLAEPALGVD